ncbi:MAG: hypothetical protein DMG25_12235, partial [Acidobacteria bacterium]
MLASRGFSDPVNYRLLAHEISHQWWRCLVSPATPDDAYLDDGQVARGQRSKLVGEERQDFAGRLAVLLRQALVAFFKVKRDVSARRRRRLNRILAGEHGPRKRALIVPEGVCYRARLPLRRRSLARSDHDFVGRDRDADRRREAVDAVGVHREPAARV